MMDYRTLSINIDSTIGKIVDNYGEQITRDNYLPKVMLADTFILKCHFVTVEESTSRLDNSPSLVATTLDEDFLAPRLICGIGNGEESQIIFTANFNSDYSDFENGIIAFLINTNSENFLNFINNATTLKAEFVIFSNNLEDSEEIIVLAKDFLMTENRPCETISVESTPIENIYNKDEVNLLLGVKANSSALTSYYTKDELDALLEDNSYVYIVDSWVSEDKSSWYRKFSDGMIEQAGVVNSSDIDSAIDLFTDYTTSTYQVQLTLMADALENSNNIIVSTTKTISSFELINTETTEDVFDIFWQTKGY